MTTPKRGQPHAHIKQMSALARARPNQALSANSGPGLLDVLWCSGYLCWKSASVSLELFRSGFRPRNVMQTSRALVGCALLIGLTACAPVPKTNVAVSGGSSTASPSVLSTAGRAATKWEYQPGFQPTASSRELPVLVSWVGCASGATPADPQPSVKYSREHVSLTVWAIPPAGSAFECQGNPCVPLTIPLTEPLGSRDVAPGPADVR